MKNLIIIPILILLAGCFTTTHPICRHNSVFAAISWGDITKSHVGIAVGFTDDKDRHAQAFTVSSENKIIWLDVHDGKIIQCQKHNFYPYVFMTVSDFQDRYIKIKEFTQEQLNGLLKQSIQK